MKNKTVRTIAIVVAGLILLAIVGLGAAVWLFSQAFNMSQVDEAAAHARIDEVRSTFAGVTPVLSLEAGHPSLVRRPPASSDGRRLSTLHVIAWNPDDGGLARIDVPFWLLRLKSGPIRISAESGLREDLPITVEDLERYGSTLVLDHTGRRGERVLVWTQ